MMMEMDARVSYELPVGLLYHFIPISVGVMCSTCIGHCIRVLVKPHRRNGGISLSSSRWSFYKPC